MRRDLLFILAAIALVLASAACRSGGVEDDPILRLSAAESLEQGKKLMEKKKYSQARQYLTHAFEVEPNSATGREALLLVADTHFLAGGSDNFIKAEARYRDFQNRFPTSTQAAYVQFQVAGSLAKRMRKPDRDQSATNDALDAFEELLRLYPASEYAATAQEEMKVIRSTLAESEFLKGEFHLRGLRLPRAAAERFETILEKYPDYAEIDKVLYHLGRAYRKSKEPEKAASTFRRLREEYPDSPWVKRIPSQEATQ